MHSQNDKQLKFKDITHLYNSRTQFAIEYYKMIYKLPAAENHVWYSYYLIYPPESECQLLWGCEEKPM